MTSYYTRPHKCTRSKRESTLVHHDVLFMRTFNLKVCHANTVKMDATQPT